MSILQEYEEIEREDRIHYEAICDYVDVNYNKNKYNQYTKEMKNVWDLDPKLWHKEELELKKKYNIINLDDVLYKKDYYKKFHNWLKKEIKPFHVIKLYDGTYSVSLYLENFEYDWKKEIRSKDSYGDGHCYDEAFYNYIQREIPEYLEYLQFDSENGMFCVYCKDKKMAENLGYKLSKLYKDEEKMIEIIKEVKKSYGNNMFDDFDIKI